MKHDSFCDWIALSASNMRRLSAEGAKSKRGSSLIKKSCSCNAKLSMLRKRQGVGEGERGGAAVSHP